MDDNIENSIELLRNRVNEITYKYDNNLLKSSEKPKLVLTKINRILFNRYVISFMVIIISLMVIKPKLITNDKKKILFKKLLLFSILLNVTMFIVWKYKYLVLNMF
jgi:hypothetical protein